MWEKEKNSMRDYYLSNGSLGKLLSPTKKNKTAAAKLMAIPDATRDDLLTKYLEKCKLEFNICFIDYRLDLNPSSFLIQIYKEVEVMKNNVAALE